MQIGRGIKAIAVNGISSAGSTGIETLVRAAYFLVITRLVGPDGYGLWTYAITFYGLLLSGASLGLETVVPFGFGRAQVDGIRQASCALVIRLVLGAVAALLLVLYALVEVSEVNQRIALILAAPAVLLRGTALLSRSIFIGLLEVRRNVPNILVGRLTELLLGFGLILGGADITILFALHSLCWALETIASWRLLQRTSSIRLVWPGLNEVKQIVRQGIPITLLDLTFAFLMSAALLLYKPYAQDFAEVGQIGVALQLASFVLAAGFAFLATAAPVLTRSRDNFDPRLPCYGMLIAISCIVATTAMLAGYELLSRPLFHIVLGQEYELARELTFFALLAAGTILLPYGFQQLLILENRLTGLIIINLLSAFAVVIAFVTSRGDLDARQAILIVLGGWILRAAGISALGLAHAVGLKKHLSKQ